MSIAIKPLIKCWLQCNRCKNEIAQLIDWSDNTNEYAFSLHSIMVRQAICQYCESKDHVMLRVKIVNEEQ